jgi:hypothetical protein
MTPEQRRRRAAANRHNKLLREQIRTSHGAGLSFPTPAKPVETKEENNVSGS